MDAEKWPKKIPPQTEEQQLISDDFMRHWHEVLASQSRYAMVEAFNHGFVVKHSDATFLKTLEVGSGLGEHINHETLSPDQKSNYVALELRECMAEKIRARFPEVQTITGDCQKPLSFPEGYFDRILAIHLLEHLPDLPSAIKEMYRLCNKKSGQFLVVIPCEGGWLYSAARKISAQRIFERRYKQSYRWHIEREHINRPHEIIHELTRYFDIEKKRFFPFVLPLINFNLCIGLSLRPK